MSELAIVDEQPIVGRDEEQLVTMTVDGQLFGLPILSVQDIVETHSITRVPLTPSAVSGVMNLRGRIVTVIDLRRILGKTDEADNRMGVTVEYHGDLYTILVDKIGEVRMLERSVFEPAPATLDPNLKQLCTGIYRLDEELLTVLDVDRVLDTETISQTPPVQFRARKPKSTEQRTKRSVRDAEEETAPSDTKAPPSDEDADAEKSNRVSAKEKPSRPAAKPEDEPEKSLFDQIGGTAAVDAATDLFYSKIIEDTQLAEFFDGVDMAGQRRKMKSFLTMATGGPNKYTGRNLRAAHAALVADKGLGAKHFDAVAGHLKATLQELNVPADLIAAALDLVGGTREDVLAGPEAPEAPTPADDSKHVDPDPSTASAGGHDATGDAETIGEDVIEQIGGVMALQAVVAAFYQNVLADPKLAGFYEDADLKQQQDALASFLEANFSVAANGQANVESGHKWLVPAKGMGDSDFNLCLAHLEAALHAKSIPEGLIFRVLAAVERNRESIVD